MLSYRHAFHAGNHADVLKHSVLMLVLEYMTRKDKPFLYIDTHAGAGLYDLQGEWARKTRDHESGISRIWKNKNRAAVPQQLHSYVHLVEDLNPEGELDQYPGSPWLAQKLLRKQDRARLFELHPEEYRNLQTLFARNKQIKSEQRDGFQALSAVLPPAEKRALILLDPPYEVKTDYETVVDAVRSAYKKFSTGVYMVWYPVVNRGWVNRLEQGFVNSGIRNILLVELATGEYTEQAGMNASGLIIINPPWQLADTLKKILPFLQKELGGEKAASRLQQLVAE